MKMDEDSKRARCQQNNKIELVNTNAERHLFGEYTALAAVSDRNKWSVRMEIFFLIEVTLDGRSESIRFCFHFLWCALLAAAVP